MIMCVIVRRDGLETNALRKKGDQYVLNFVQVKMESVLDMVDVEERTVANVIICGWE